MKAAPTLEGGLRIDAEDPSDWDVLQAIIQDAQPGAIDLASQLGGLIDERAGAEDWREYVVPDLREDFSRQLDQVAHALRSAMAKSSGGPGSVWISRDDGFLWYGALNQARLSLEELYRFGPGDAVAIGQLSAAKRSAFLRSQFYFTIQSLLLDHVLS